MTESLLALGGNLPAGDADVTSTLRLALSLLDEHPQISVARTSRWYRSPAYPVGSGPDFINGAAVLWSDLAPMEILVELHRVEADLGRERRTRWAPRTCDLDLIGHRDTVLPDRETVREWIAKPSEVAAQKAPDRLILPHPRLHERAFVLLPLRDVAPDWRHPVLQQTVEEMAENLTEDEKNAVISVG